MTYTVRVSDWFNDYDFVDKTFDNLKRQASIALGRPVEKLQLIDLTKYDIVEKKDAKIARLEQEIADKESERNETLICAEEMLAEEAKIRQEFQIWKKLNII